MLYKYNNFYEMLQYASDEYPNKTAIFFEKGDISYKQFKQKVDKVGIYLHSIGVNRGDRVAMVVSNSPEFIIAYFAITSIGAIVVPINTLLTANEIEFILKDCAAEVIFVSADKTDALIPLLDKFKLRSIVTGMVCPRNGILFNDIFKLDMSYNKIYRPLIDDIACIIYTSGTTGHPKGAILSYKNIFSNLIGTKEVLQIVEKDRFIVYLPMFHSFTITATILLPIYSAASLVVISSIFPFAPVLKQTLLKKVTVFFGIPGVFAAMSRSRIPWYFKLFNKIRVFICGSAPLSKQIIEDFKKNFTKAELLEGYGLSECSPIVSVNRFKNTKVLSVGIPLPGYQVKIVDDNLIEVPNSIIGEIVVKGDCVMQGYLNNPVATDEAMINGWLRTGDLGKMDDNGFIYIVDRLKDVIISKGQNIYPREIEEELYKFEQVEAAAVIGVKDSLEDETVVALIKLKPHYLVDPNLIKIKLRKRLASFKIPKSIYFVNELPVNATGKVMKKELRNNLSEYLN